MTEARLRELLESFETAVRRHEGEMHSGYSWNVREWELELESCRESFIDEVTRGGKS